MSPSGVVLTLNGVLFNGNAGIDSISFTGDTVAGSSLLGGQGVDTINTGAALSSLVNGNIGNDVLTIDGVSANSSFFGGQDNDTITVSSNATTSVISGDLGNDTITVAAVSVASSTLNGGDGNDTINATLATSTVIANGGNGNDAITTNASADTIDGGAGNDTITAEVGNDVITGGAGADVFNQIAADSTAASATTATATTGGAAITFTYANGVDVITDFSSSGGDSLLIDGTLTALLTNSGTTIVATNTALFRGNWNDTTKVFVTSAIGTDILAGTSGAHTADAAITTSLLGANSMVLVGAANGFVTGSTIV